MIRRRKAHRRGDKVRNRYNQIRHRVNHLVDVAVALLLAGDLEHLVLDHVAQVQRLQDQVQEALEHNFVAHLDGDRRTAGDAVLGQSLRIQMNVDLSKLGQPLQYAAERLVVELQRHRRPQLLLDLQLPLRPLPATLLHQP